jgi:hypothetical protein
LELGSDSQDGNEFPRPIATIMSLNRMEQRLFDHLRSRPEERSHWMEKVRTISRAEADEHAASRRIEQELWSYQVERSGAVAEFREAAAREGLQRTSLRNLAELLLRLWTEPRPKQAPGISRPED